MEDALSHRASGFITAECQDAAPVRFQETKFKTRPICFLEIVHFALHRVSSRNLKVNCDHYTVVVIAVDTRKNFTSDTRSEVR